jgi:hypothetical protein
VQITNGHLGIAAKIVEATLVVSAIVVAGRGDWGNVIRFLLMFALALGVAQLRLPKLVELFFASGLLLEGWANAQQWYTEHGWIDIPIHFILGGTAGVVAYLALTRVFAIDSPSELVAWDKTATALVLTVTSATTLGVLWEFYEWAAHELGAGITVGYADTLLDLAMDMTGSLVVGLAMVERLQRRRRTYTRTSRELGGEPDHEPRRDPAAAAPGPSRG